MEPIQTKTKNIAKASVESSRAHTHVNDKQSHECGHGCGQHEHGHEHEHEHLHEHKHLHGHDHMCPCDHSHGHEHEQEHEHGHDHEHGHGCGHDHEHGHGCGHDHEHGHGCGHGHHPHTRREVHRESVLDDIGCGCSGCMEAHGHKAQTESVLDDIGCGCSSCALPAETVQPSVLQKIIATINRIPILARIGLSLILFSLGFLQPLFFLAAYAVAGVRIVFTALKRINMLDEFFLMTIASIGAIAIGEFPEAAAVMILFEIGEFFKDKAIDKSKNAISDLLALRPKEVTVLRAGIPYVLMPEEVEIGDTLIVKVGERIALDGVLLSPDAEINNAAISGESAPISVQAGTDILSGGVVMGHPIEVKVTKVFSDSTIAKIIALVQDAKESKTPTEQFITKFARVYTPFVVVSAIAMIAIPTLIFGTPTFTEWLHRGLIFLVVSCPCALVISVPLSYFAGIGKASSHGVLFKGSSYLDAMADASRIVFDKTGTLTTGEFTVARAELKDESLYSDIYEMEKGSLHPLAVAICDYAEKQHDPTTSRQMSQIIEIAGKGIKARFHNGDVLIIGNQKLMHDEKVTTPEPSAAVTTIFVAQNGAYAGKFELSDRVREDSAASIQELKATIKTTLLSGDQPEVTAAVASSLGIDEFRGSLLPADKYTHVKSLVEQGETVVFVGDGINDAPVLAGATIGISMGLSGSDAAIEASDAVLMKPGISALPTVIRISKHTKRIVLENIILSLGIKVAVLTLSALGFATMWMAVVADVGAALLAVLNTLRITARAYEPISQ